MHAPDRAVGIVIHKNRILLIERKKGGEHFWVFPGGGVDKGENIEDAVVREVKEESCLDVAIQKKLYTHIYSSEHKGRGDQHFYLCTYISGEPKLGDSNEKVDMDSGVQYYKPRWIPMSTLDTLLLYPLEIRDWLIQDFKNDFQDAPREAHISPEDLRQGL